MTPSPGSELLSYYSARAREYEAIYDKPERQPDLRRLAFLLRETLADRNVLEVACGTGYWTERIAPVAARVRAHDLSDEVLAVARSKSLPSDRVQFAKADAFYLPEPPFPCDAAVAGFWWSHIPKARVREFLAGLHARLEPGASVALFDNRFVPGSNTPISRTADSGDTFQTRRLGDGSTHEVLKNFLSREDLLAAIAPDAAEPEIVQLTYFWFLRYGLK
jgi:SAM-dependent methyltransferase